MTKGLKNLPTTKREARRVVYGHTFSPMPYVESRCAYTVCGIYGPYQCSRKPVAGPSDLYCGQHASKLPNHGVKRTTRK